MLDILVSAKAKLPSKHGSFFVQSFKEGDKEHLAIMTESLGCEAPLVRIHSECLTGDALGSLRCDCQEQLQGALELISEAGCGIVLYLRQEGRGIGLFNKINAYKLQDEGLDTAEANHQLGFASDERSFEIALFMLNYYSILKVKLLTNNPKKLSSLGGIEIVERIAMKSAENEFNKHYLKTKKEKFGHLI